MNTETSYTSLRKYLNQDHSLTIKTTIFYQKNHFTTYMTQSYPNDCHIILLHSLLLYFQGLALDGYTLISHSILTKYSKITASKGIWTRHQHVTTYTIYTKSTYSTWQAHDTKPNNEICLFNVWRTFNTHWKFYAENRTQWHCGNEPKQKHSHILTLITKKSENLHLFIYDTLFEAACIVCRWKLLILIST